MKNFFYLQRNDRRSLLWALAAVAAGSALTIYLGRQGDGTPDATADSRTAPATDNRPADSGRPTAGTALAVERPVSLFTFDPNTADSSQLARLGLSAWQIRNLYKYRAAGGRFSRPRDFARLYGLTAGQFKALEPYISIAEEYRPAAEVYAPAAPKTFTRDTLRYPRKLQKGEHVSLNTADTAMLKRVPGIGSSFARAIVAYRNRLGGYYDTRQLLEIDNFPADALPYFVLSPDQCRKLNVNRCSLSQLRRHPYIGFYQAKTIIEHRRLHGPLSSLDDLRNYRDFTAADIERLSHYVEF